MDRAARKKESTRKWRLTPRGRAMRKENDKVFQARVRLIPPRPPDEIHKCRRCGIEKPFSDFYLSVCTATGYMCKCKICALASNAKRYRENKSVVQAQQRKYTDKNRDRINATVKARNQRKRAAMTDAERKQLAGERKAHDQQAYHKYRYGKFDEVNKLLLELSKEIRHGKNK